MRRGAWGGPQAPGTNQEAAGEGGEMSAVS